MTPPPTDCYPSLSLLAIGWRRCDRTLPVPAEQFAPLLADILDDIGVVRRRAADERIDGRQEDVLKLGEEFVNDLLAFELRQQVLIDVLSAGTDVILIHPIIIISFTEPVDTFRAF